MPTIRRPDPAEVRAAREARRLRAAELFALGRTQAEVARDLGVSRQAVSVWHARFAQGGVDALRSRGPTGPDQGCRPPSSPRSSRPCWRERWPMGSIPTCGPWNGWPW